MRRGKKTRKQHKYLCSFHVFLTRLCVPSTVRVVNLGLEQGDPSGGNKWKRVREVGGDK